MPKWILPKNFQMACTLETLGAETPNVWFKIHTFVKHIFGEFFHNFKHFLIQNCDFFIIHKATPMHNRFVKNATAFTHGWNATYTNPAEVDAEGNKRSYKYVIIPINIRLTIILQKFQVSDLSLNGKRLFWEFTYLETQIFQN